MFDYSSLLGRYVVDFIICKKVVVKNICLSCKLYILKMGQVVVEIEMICLRICKKDISNCQNATCYCFILLPFEPMDFPFYGLVVT